MKFFEGLDATFGKTFENGDQEVLTWFLVRQSTLPFVLCGLYAIFVTKIGPALMENRKPLTLRKPMILFNLFLVTSYSTALAILFVNLPKVGMKKFCLGTTVQRGDITYMLVRWMWFLYILKYVEFIDTIFFILRKKNHLITNLHVLHHTIVPLVGWVMLRTETSGFQSIPVMVNAVVHVIMYTYYGLAAVGPQMKKYLWWKKYLTMLQMLQFVFIIFFVVVLAPITGCSLGKSSALINFTGGSTFLLLFYNFYAHTFGNKQKSV